MKKSYVNSKAISKTRKNQEKILFKIEEEESEKRYSKLKEQQKSFQFKFAITILLWIIGLFWVAYIYYNI